MKRFLTVSLSFLALGLALTAAQRNLGWELGGFLRGYWIGAATILLISSVLSVLYRRGFRRILDRAAVLLDEGKPDEYITTVERLLGAALGSQLKSEAKLELATGYFAKKDYPEAIRLLEELENAPLSPAKRVQQRLELCISYLYSSRLQKALAVYEKSDRLFDPCRADEVYGRYMTLLDMMADVQREDFAAARERLDAARKSWKAMGLDEDFNEMEQLIREKTKGRTVPKDSRPRREETA